MSQRSGKKVQSIFDRLIAQARSNGQLNLANQSMTSVPPVIFHINDPDYTLASNKIEDEKTERADKWWEQEPLHRLSLASNALTILSDDIGLLDQLVVLDLNDNQLTSLPEGLAQCRRLQRLLLSHNSLQTIPSAVLQLHDLRVLRLDHNKLAHISADIGNLFYLEELDLSHNFIECVPKTIHSLRVTKLQLGHNNVAALPVTIGLMQSLRQIDISQNKLTELIGEIGELEKLEILHANENKISIVHQFTKSFALQELHLSSNCIAVFPSNFFQSLTRLKIVDLRGNKLKEFPCGIVDLGGLERLMLDRNDISYVPPEISLIEGLKSLSLLANPIRSIRKDVLQRSTPELLKFLRDRLEPGEVQEQQTLLKSPRVFDVVRSRCLDLSNRGISEIQDSLIVGVKGQDIVSVNLSKNKFSKLPPELLPLNAWMNDLNLSYNIIRTLCPDIGEFQHLTHLNLASNGLSALPDQLGSCRHLRELNMSINRFESIPMVVYNLKMLEVLLLSDNLLDTIDVANLSQLPALGALDFRNNNIKSVPPELGNFVSLKNLWLEGNVFKVPTYAVLAKGTGEVLKYLRNRL